MEIFPSFLAFVCGITFCFASFEDRLLKLENLVEVHNSDYNKLKSRVVKVEHEIASLKTGAADLMNGGENPLSDVTEGDEDIEHTSPYLSDFTELISRRASSFSAAFQAHLSATHCYHDHEAVIFDVEDFDVGGVPGFYNQGDGIFEPPVSGLYVLTWTVAAPSESRSFVTELMISGRMVGVITSDPDTGLQTDGNSEPTAQRSIVAGSGVHPSTAIVVVQMNAGNRCYIRMRFTSGTCTNILSGSNVVRTSFSGWRLF